MLRLLAFFPLLLTLPGPVGLAAGAPPEPALVVIEKIASRVAFYTAAGERVAEAEAGPVPHEMVFSPDGKYLYVSDNGILWMTDPGSGGNTISIIDVKARERAGVIDLGDYRRPHGLDVDPRTGRLVCTIENPDGLLLIDPVKRKVLRKYDVRGEDPHMVTLGPHGEYAYVSNTASGTVAAVHLATGEVKLIPVAARPQGGALSPDGRLLYVTCEAGDSIAILDTARRERVGVIETGKGPNRIGVTPDGATLVYSMEEGGGAVGFADAATRKQRAVVKLGGRPLSLNLSRDGKLAYAGVQDRDEIYVVSVPERKTVQVIRTPKGAGPDPVLPLP